MPNIAISNRLTDDIFTITMLSYLTENDLRINISYHMFTVLSFPLIKLIIVCDNDVKCK